MDNGRTAAARYDLVLSRARHPSFSPALAEHLVAPLSRRQLHRLWQMTGNLVDTELSQDVRLNLVVLREHVLARLEDLDPRALATCARSVGLT